MLVIEPSEGRRPLVFSWGVSSYSGWGLYGLNLSLALSGHATVRPIAAQTFDPGDLVLDPLRQDRMTKLHETCRALWLAMDQVPDDIVSIDAPVLIALGHDLRHFSHDTKTVAGRPSIGVPFIEHATLSPAGRQRADQYALMIAGSTWNENVLRANGVVAVTTVLQGVDTSLFHPAPRTGQFKDRFVVFSGGALEFRKGQDLVVRAFRAFSARHKEAVLMTAWHTPWVRRDQAMAAATGTVAAERTADDAVDTARWAMDNGVPPEVLISLGPVPNIAMPHVIREADVALFPNRCEGWTNPAAMECMACGIPTILSANTGHMDLLRQPDVALALNRQREASCAGYDTREWGESDVEEIIETLETVWQDRQAAAALGRRGAAFIATMPWQRQAELLLRAIDPLLP